MELDIHIDNDSLSVTIDNPYQLDIKAIMTQIEGFLSSRGVPLNDMDIEGLIPRMVKGIAGCEKGCPADAKTLVSRGYKKFDLAYIEGGILSAKSQTEDKKVLSLKMFPDF
jgi:hypothetical protein